MESPQIIEVGVDRYLVLQYVAKLKTYICVKYRDVQQMIKFDYAVTTEVYMIADTPKITITKVCNDCDNSPKKGETCELCARVGK